MSYTVTFQNYSKSFMVEENELILDAAIRQGINFPYTCTKGFCGACKGELLSGEIEYVKEPKKLERLAESEKTELTSLFCSCIAKSNLLIDIKIIDELENITVDNYPVKIVELLKLAPDVLMIKLKIPENRVFNFLPGQYIDILLENEKRRSFSLANSLVNNQYLELHIRLVENGYFTPDLFKNYNQGDILRIEGPHGAFFHKKNNRPMIFIAGGTGFAPVKSIVEQLINDNNNLPIFIYWGVRDIVDLYLPELPQLWANVHHNISYQAVLSQNTDSHWLGKTGYVHEALLKDFDSFDKYDVYASGPPAMIEAIKSELLKKGLNLDNFYFDSFDYAEE